MSKPVSVIGGQAVAKPQHYRVLITEPLADEPLAWLDERCRVTHCASDDPEFKHHLTRTDALIVRTYTNVDAALLAEAPRLRVVGRAGVGVDNIDLEACAARDITVVYTPDANTTAVVEYVFAQLFAHYRPDPNVLTALNLAEWQMLRNANVARLELGEQTLGILGLGRIGKRVAAVAEALQMTVLFHDLAEIPAAETSKAKPVSFAALLAEADILTIHIDGRPENRHLFNQEKFAALKPTVLLINSARGMLLDPAAAAAFFRANHQAAAVLDVHHPEPIPHDYPLLALPNVKLTPHSAGRSVRGLLRMSAVVHDVYAVLQGKNPQYPAPQYQ